MIDIDDVISEEWRQFQLVNHKGGRADCQDNHIEFYLMRKSQFMTWPKEIVKSYYQDLMEAKEEGRNLIFEKYAFMMKSTAPQEYEELKDFLPAFTRRKQQLIDEIADIQTGWAKDFEKRYPAYAGNGRPVCSKEDTLSVTSVETYLRGELSTYGEDTIILYADFIRKCKQNGLNLTDAVRENMAKLYGYTSVKEVEEKIAKGKESGRIRENVL